MNYKPAFDASRVEIVRVVPVAPPPIEEVILHLHPELARELLKLIGRSTGVSEALYQLYQKLDDALEE